MASVGGQVDSEMTAAAAAGDAKSLSLSTTQYQDFLRMMNLDDAREDVEMLERIEQWVRYPVLSEHGSRVGSPNGNRSDVHSNVTIVESKPSEAATKMESQVSLDSTDETENDDSATVLPLMEALAASLLLQRLIRSFQQRKKICVFHRDPAKSASPSSEDLTAIQFAPPPRNYGDSLASAESSRPPLEREATKDPKHPVYFGLERNGRKLEAEGTSTSFGNPRTEVNPTLDLQLSPPSNQSEFRHAFSPYTISDLGESRGNFSNVRHLKLSPRVFSGLLGVANDLVKALPKIEAFFAGTGRCQGLTLSRPPLSVAQVATRCLERLLAQSKTECTEHQSSVLNSKMSTVCETTPRRSASSLPPALTQYQTIAAVLKSRSLGPSPSAFAKHATSRSDSPTGLSSQSSSQTLPASIDQGANGKEEQSSLEVQNEDALLTSFLTRTLLTLRRHAVQCVEGSYDFAYLFHSCYKLPRFRKVFAPIPKSGPSSTLTTSTHNRLAGDTNPPLTLRETVWSLACAVSQRQEHFRLRQQRQLSPSGGGSNRKGAQQLLFPWMLGRRQKLVVMAATMALVGCLSDIEGDSPGVSVDSASLLTVSAPCPSGGINDRKDGAVAGGGSQFDDAAEDAAPDADGPHAAKRPKLDHTLRDSATPPAASRAAALGCRQDIGGALSGTDDVVDLIVGIANRLCTYLAWASFDEEGIHSISRSEIEAQIFGMMRDVGSLTLIQQQPHEPPLPPPRNKMPHTAFWATLRTLIPKPRFLKSNLAMIVQALQEDTMGRFTLPPGSKGPEIPTWHNPNYQIPVSMVAFFKQDEFLVDAHDGTQQSINRLATIDDGDVLARVCPYVCHRPYSRDYLVAVVHKNSDTNDNLVDQIGQRISAGDATISDNSSQVVNVDHAGRRIATIHSDSSNTSSSPPPLITDEMELNEWTISVVSLSVIKPSGNLLKFLRGRSCATLSTAMSARSTKDPLSEVVVPILNRALTRIHQDISQGQRRWGSEQQCDSTGVSRMSPISVGVDDGHVYIECDDKDVTPDVQLCAAVIGLYYHALEAILHDEFGRSPQGHQSRFSSERNERLVCNQAFHRALLVCCYTCVLKAVGAHSNKISRNLHKKIVIDVSSKHHELTIYSLLQTMESSPYTYLKVTESFVRALTPQQDASSPPLSSAPTSSQAREDLNIRIGSPVLFGLPRVLQRHIRRTEVQVMDSVVWTRNFRSHFRADWRRRVDQGEESGGESLFHVIGRLQSTISAQSDWPPQALSPTLPQELENLGVSHSSMRTMTRTETNTPEAHFVSYIFRKLLKISHARIQCLCHGLGIPPVFPIVNESWVALRYLLRQHVDLLFDRHLDQLILCTIYGVCKIMKLQPEVTFARIIDVYVSVRGRELGERSCQRIVRHIKLRYGNDGHIGEGSLSTAGNVVALKHIGSIIDLYNHIYVPRMKRHLLKAKSIKCSTKVLAQAMAAARRQAGRGASIPNGANTNDVVVASSADGGNGSVESPSVAKQQEWKNRVVSPGPSAVTPVAGKQHSKLAAQGQDSGSAGAEFRTFLEFGGVASLKDVTA